MEGRLWVSMIIPRPSILDGAKQVGRFQMNQRGNLEKATKVVGREAVLGRLRSDDLVSHQGYLNLCYVLLQDSGDVAERD
ncbi:UNVERIFIED_CONTAM: hypothetical protein Sradi_2369700 [Sesamum radiatum]|uniref:Uncharacterized protein n=1 Tax=Sesamum radiatum TaxID=300843 RepID=A0AAW2T747_SESRA